MQSLIYVIDDDDAVRDSLCMLLNSIGYSTLNFAQPLEFLDYLNRERKLNQERKTFKCQSPRCALLDIRMPGMNGMELFRKISQEADFYLPCIIITGHGDIPMAVEALKSGVFDFLPKPFREQELLNTLEKALEEYSAQNQKIESRLKLEAEFNTLTQREKEVALELINGEHNKAIAAKLAISPRTVEIHRARVLEKMAVSSVALLVKKLAPL